MVVDDFAEQQRTGLHQGMIVQCRVTGHRDRFGVDVEISSRPDNFPGFIDLPLLTEREQRLSPDEFPPVGSIFDAVVVCFMPNGELRLNARPSMIGSWKDKPAP